MRSEHCHPIEELEPYYKCTNFKLEMQGTHFKVHSSLWTPVIIAYFMFPVLPSGKETLQ